MIRFYKSKIQCFLNKKSKTSIFKVKLNLSLNSLYYALACNELAKPISAPLRPGNTAPFEEMSQRWRAVGNTVSDLTGPRFEPQTSRSRDKRVTARPSDQYLKSFAHFRKWSLNWLTIKVSLLMVERVKKFCSSIQ